VLRAQQPRTIVERRPATRAGSRAGVRSRPRTPATTPRPQPRDRVSARHPLRRRRHGHVRHQAASPCESRM